MATQIKLDLECDNGHWVGIIDESTDGPGRKVAVPTYCPHASCGQRLKPWVRRKKAA